MTLFVLVLHVLRTAFGFIFLNSFYLYYVFLYHFVCFIMYFIVHAAFMHIKPMMMMIAHSAPALFAQGTHLVIIV